MSIVSPASAGLPSIAPAAPAERIRNCIKLLNGLTAAGQAKSDMDFVRDELIDLLIVFHDLSSGTALKALAATMPPAASTGPEVTKPA